LAPREKRLAERLGDFDVIEMHNPLNEKKFNPSIPVEDLKREFSVRNECIVTFVGRLEDEKNALGFIDAVHMIKNQVQNVIFFIVGYGPQRSEVEARVREFGLDDRIIITGTRNDVNAFCAVSDIFVAIDLSDNLWSNTMIEAMASGCACIVTDVGDTGDYLRHIDDVYIIPVSDTKAISDALLLLIQDEKLRKQLAENALRYITDNNFYQKDVMKKLLSIYKEVLTA
jgi:glycosyltransferase involved in cell wall biosynthesis